MFGSNEAKEGFTVYTSLVFCPDDGSGGALFRGVTKGSDNGGHRETRVDEHP